MHEFNWPEAAVLIVFIIATTIIIIDVLNNP